MYCNLTDLSYKFSTSFRKMVPYETINDVKNRNKKFAQWAKLLRESVELFGKDASDYDCKIKTFFHGTSYLLFDSFASNFCGPTSCSTQIEVAILFTSQKNGIILDLKHNNYDDTMYFNVSFVSCFGSEDERLFCGGLRTLKFSSIRLLIRNKWHNYQSYITSITKYHNLIKGEGGRDLDKKDSFIICSLIDNIINNKINKFPIYINQIFKQFTKKIKTIKINLWSDDCFPYSNSYFNNFFLCSKKWNGYDRKGKERKEKYLLNFNSLINLKNNLFPNLKQIILQYHWGEYL